MQKEKSRLEQLPLHLDQSPSILIRIQEHINTSRTSKNTTVLNTSRTSTTTTVTEWIGGGASLLLHHRRRRHCHGKSLTPEDPQRKAANASATAGSTAESSRRRCRRGKQSTPIFGHRPSVVSTRPAQAPALLHRSSQLPMPLPRVPPAAAPCAPWPWWPHRLRADRCRLQRPRGWEVSGVDKDAHSALPSPYPLVSGRLGSAQLGYYVCWFL